MVGRAAAIEWTSELGEGTDDEVTVCLERRPAPTARGTQVKAIVRAIIATCDARQREANRWRQELCGRAVAMVGVLRLLEPRSRLRPDTLPVQERELQRRRLGNASVL